MIKNYRSRVPLRIGLAGGGTDVSPYCELFGGAILNATISKYAYASIRTLDSDEILISSFDMNASASYPLSDCLPIDGTLDLAKGVYNRMVRDFNLKPTGFHLKMYVDAPVGSGLGTSSALVVAILGAFAEWLRIPLGEYDAAQLAYDIERKDLKLAGGKQDQYAATFGGVNFMEFFKDDKVIVNPLRIKKEYLYELEHNLVLFYTDTNRESGKIIEQQQQNVKDEKTSSIEAMHQLKQQAIQMKEALLMGKINDIGPILDYGFEQKRKMAKGISNPMIEELYEAVKKAGSTGGKISGAGGGGFMTFFCPNQSKYDVMRVLKDFAGSVHPYSFVKEGLITWTNYS